MRHWVCLWKAGCGGGAYILCRLPTPPCRYSEGAFLLGCLPPLSLAYFAAPIPPTPFPAGRGKPRLFHARGFAPCIPGAEPGRHRLSLPSRYPGRGEQVPPGGLPSLSPACPAFSLLSRPHPPDPLPLRGRGRPRLFQARGFAPCIPGAGRGRAPAMPAVPIPKAPCGRKIGHKPLGSVNTQYSGKVLGGLGDSFKSPPAFSPAFFPSFPPSPRQMLPDGRGCGSVPAGA